MSQLLRSYIRSILVEDRQEFLKHSGEMFSRHETGELEGPALQRMTKAEWNRHADHEFFRGLSKVHWVRKLEDLLYLIDPGSRRDEVSASLYGPGEPLLPPKKWRVVGNNAAFSLGIKLEGRVTLAANDMNDLVTPFSKIDSIKNYDTYELHKKTSGQVKRANVQGPKHYENYIFDADSFKEDRGRLGNEGVVANWKPVSIIVTPDYHRKSSASLQKKLKELMKNDEILNGLPLIDPSGNLVQDS